MGFFGRFAYSGSTWIQEEPTNEPYLIIDIHDSDIATVIYRPSEGTDGCFYLGCEPRIYFEDPEESSPVDRKAEAIGFAQWVERLSGRRIGPEDVEKLMAPADEEGGPEDVFVEETVQRLLRLADLPLPPALPAGNWE